MMKNGIPSTTLVEKIIPGIWARLVLQRSGWTPNRVDSTFFCTLGTDIKKGPPRGTSAFLRYLACQSEIRKIYEAANDPFLQIDSVWPGTFRYLAYPCFDLFEPQMSLAFIHERMVMTDWRFASLLFAGSSIAARRNYKEPAAEIKALRNMWRETKNPRHRVHYFPDMLCLVLGWIQEAGIIGDFERLKVLPEFMPVKSFGISFRQLNFLERSFAEFLDRWLSLIAENFYERDAYRLSRVALAYEMASKNPRVPSNINQLDGEGLVTAIFQGEHTTELSVAELLFRTKLNGAMKAKFVRKVGWDRSELLEN